MDRRSFLKRFGGIFGAGVAVAAVPKLVEAEVTLEAEPLYDSIGMPMPPPAIREKIYADYGLSVQFTRNQIKSPLDDYIPLMARQNKEFWDRDIASIYKSMAS
jgi:hypothetical protein